MALVLRCDKCDQELSEPGALVFSPPDHITLMQVDKFHICKECWLKFLQPLIFNQ